VLRLWRVPSCCCRRAQPPLKPFPHRNRCSATNPATISTLPATTNRRDYFHRLAASSNRIKLISVGKTTRGLDWEIALISSPQNLAKLDHYKSISQRLALAADSPTKPPRRWPAKARPSCTSMAECTRARVAGAQQSILLAYKLVATQGDPEIDAILDNVIVMLWPTLNPDGQNEIAAWYRKNLGTPYEVSPCRICIKSMWATTTNRDGYMNNMLESREVTRAELEFNPVVFYCHHQTAPFPARIFIPPFTEPISSNIHPLMMRWLNVLGINMGAYLDEHQMPGAVHRVGFDNWYPGFLDFAGIFATASRSSRNTALYRYATPHFYTVEDFPKDRQLLRSEVFYNSPWKRRLVAARRRRALHAGRLHGGVGHGGEIPRGAALQPLPGGPRQHRSGFATSRPSPT